MIGVLLRGLTRWACPNGTVAGAWDVDSHLLTEDRPLDSAELRRRASAPYVAPPFRATHPRRHP